MRFSSNGEFSKLPCLILSTSVGTPNIRVTMLSSSSILAASFDWSYLIGFLISNSVYRSSGSASGVFPKRWFEVPQRGCFFECEAPEEAFEDFVISSTTYLGIIFSSRSVDISNGRIHLIRKGFITFRLSYGPVTSVELLSCCPLFCQPFSLVRLEYSMPHDGRQILDGQLRNKWVQGYRVSAKQKRWFIRTKGPRIEGSI